MDPPASSVSPTACFKNLLGDKTLPASVAVETIDELLKQVLANVLALNIINPQICHVGEP
jgi:hypothetical protein